MQAAPGEAQRFRLRKHEILRGKRAFEYLFKHGSSFRIGVLAVLYVLDVPEIPADSALSAAFAAPKRLFKKASQRNAVKRRLREAWRLHKQLLYPAVLKSGKALRCLVTYKGPVPPDYHEIEAALLRIIEKLNHRIEHAAPPAEPAPPAAD